MHPYKQESGQVTCRRQPQILFGLITFPLKLLLLIIYMSGDNYFDL
ncbi:Uncharacterized protein HZ326_28266, partial [Fusarium oxysporum f. sp. albedinis]